MLIGQIALARQPYLGHNLARWYTRGGLFLQPTITVVVQHCTVYVIAETL